MTNILYTFNMLCGVKYEKCWTSTPDGYNSANTRRCPDVGPMLGQRRRRLPSVGPTSGQRLVFAGNQLYINIGPVSRELYLFTLFGSIKIII